MKLQSLSLLSVALTASLLLSSCASILTKSHQNITFTGLPGTTIIDQQKNKTLTELDESGMSTVKLRKQLSTKNLLIVKDGYEHTTVKLSTEIQSPFWCNIILGGLIGMGVDAATGKMMKFSDELVNVTLYKKLPDAEKPETVDDTKDSD